MITDNNQCRKVNITESRGYKICYISNDDTIINKSKGIVTFKL